MIQTVKEQRNIETNELTGYLLNGIMFVPIAEGNTHYQQIQQWIKEGNMPEPAFTEEERLNYFKNKKINELKQIRDDKVKSITVTLTTGEVLDGDEESQNRFTRAINGLPDDTTTINWIDVNNNSIDLTRPQLQEALTLAGQVQTEIFVQYNNYRIQVNNAITIDEVNNIVWQ